VLTMKYQIHCDGKVIAAFLNESDRDLCFDALCEAYDDCVFMKAEI
jgi:hypothetical protein